MERTFASSSDYPYSGKSRPNKLVGAFHSDKTSSRTERTSVENKIGRRSVGKTDKGTMMLFVLYILGWSVLKGAAVIDGVGHENTYENLKISFAKAVNMTDFWICSQVMTGGTGFPWKVIPLSWPEMCYFWLTKQNITASDVVYQNCTLMVNQSMINFGDQPNYFPTEKPQPILVRNHREQGFQCFSINKNDSWKQPWKAGNSTCKYYLTPTQNATIQFLHPNGTSDQFVDYILPPMSKLWSEGKAALLANAGTYWICGDSAYKWLPSGWYGSCYMGILAPPFRVTKTLPEGHPRHRRMIDTSDRPIISEGSRFLYVMCPMCAARKYGTYINKLSASVEQLANDTVKVLNSTSLNIFSYSGNSSNMYIELCYDTVCPFSHSML